MTVTEEEYVIPKWCQMLPSDHNDGMGGCWGISYGYVAKDGANWCKNCEFANKEYIDTELKRLND